MHVLSVPRFEQLSDAQILHELALRVDYLRRQKGLSDRELAERGGLGVRTLVAFRSNNKDITLGTFLHILRGLGELERLDGLLPPAEPTYSPADGGYVAPPKRVRKKRAPEKPSDFRWGDEK